MDHLTLAKGELLSAVKSGLKGFPLKKSHGPRSVADRIESAVSDLARNRFAELYSPPRSVRSPEDFSVRLGSATVYVDVKTHFVQETAGFSMPNLISIAKLRTLLENEEMALLYIFVDYARDPSGAVSIQKVESAYVWELDWRILRIGALGKGQLQISNANNALVFTTSPRSLFLDRLRSEAVKFYATQEGRMKRERLKWEDPAPFKTPRP